MGENNPSKILILRYNDRFEVWVKSEKVFTSTDFGFMLDLVEILNRADADYYVRSLEILDFDVSGI